MIDRLARENLAERLRHLASGAISNFEFEERARHSQVDRAIHEIDFNLAWRFYDDFKEHRLAGGWALTDGHKRDFARAVLFLKGDCEYRWPRRHPLAAWGWILLRVLSFGQLMQSEPKGDVRFWPFWSRDEYHEALKHAPYLAANQTKH
jgi:hypothetical protein